jgi:N-acetylglucosamine kinase-like BadF-type ATPase
MSDDKEPKPVYVIYDEVSGYVVAEGTLDELEDAIDAIDAAQEVCDGTFAE